MPRLLVEDHVAVASGRIGRRAHVRPVARLFAGTERRVPLHRALLKAVGAEKPRATRELLDPPIRRTQSRRVVLAGRKVPRLHQRGRGARAGAKVLGRLFPVTHREVPALLLDRLLAALRAVVPGRTLPTALVGLQPRRRAKASRRALVYHAVHAPRADAAGCHVDVVAVRVLDPAVARGDGEGLCRLFRAIAPRVGAGRRRRYADRRGPGGAGVSGRALAHARVADLPRCVTVETRATLVRLVLHGRRGAPIADRACAVAVGRRLRALRAVVACAARSGLVGGATLHAIVSRSARAGAEPSALLP